MGLEHVELLMECEAEFGIKIQDDEYVECSTLGAIHRVILRHLQIDEASSPPIPQVAQFESFFAVRDLILNFTELAPNQIKLKTRVYDLIPRTNRKAFWKELNHSVGGTMPFKPLTIGFVFGFGLLLILLFCAFVAFTGVLAVYINIETGIIFFAVMGGAVLPMLANYLYESLRKRETRKDQTVEDVVRWSKLAAWRTEQQSGNRWREANAEEVWERLVEITAEIVLMPTEEIKKVSRLIEDLKMG